ncbi:MAG: nucleoside-triphosphatase [Candidatus Thorarchaeota archaeon]
MKTKFLITGPPRSGKSTLIVRLIEYLSKRQITVYGFLTPEVKVGKNRIGFDILNIKSKEREELARKGDLKTKFHVGKYCVFIEKFENFISNIDNITFQKEDFIIIDEIGKMELFSKKFQEFIIRIFDSDISIIATIGLTIKHPIKDHLLNLPDVEIFKLNIQNFQRIFLKITSMI